MITALAVCPPAPWLIPRLARGLAAAATGTGEACLRAVQTLGEVDRIVIVGVGLEPGYIPPGSDVGAAGLDRSDHPVAPQVTLPDGLRAGDAPAGTGLRAGDAPDGIAPPGARPGVGVAVAAHLLVAVGTTTAACAWQVTQCGRTPSCPPPLKDAATALLVMADGSACHGDGAPGGPDSRAVEFDDDLAAALSSGDPDRLRGTCRRLADAAVALRADTLPALAVATDLIRHAGPAHARVTHRSAQFGVGHQVATWSWVDPR
jgi:hypothetical protein